MASYEEVIAGLDQLPQEDRRRTLDHLNQSLPPLVHDDDHNQANGGVDNGNVEPNENVLPADGNAEPAAGLLDASMSARDTFSRPPLRKLRLFSGKMPPSTGEVDFETWRLQAKQLLEDVTISEGNKKIMLLQSLLRPALDTISSISRTSSSEDCINMLETLYGKVEDGHDLVVAFHTTYQEDREATSAYLNRLYLILVQAADRGGLSVTDIQTYLLRQFIRGCQDDSFVHRLNLESKTSDPPGFGDLLLMIRKEESRRTEKRIRMKRQSSSIPGTSSVSMDDNQGKSASSGDVRTKKLEAQVHQLTSQLEAMQKKQSGFGKRDQAEAKAEGTELQPSTAEHKTKRLFFCFRCGTDGHRKARCRKEANPELVFQKLNQSN